MVATVRHPAPAFKKQAVVNGLFEEVSLEQYKGKWVVLALHPPRFHLCLPHRDHCLLWGCRQVPGAWCRGSLCLHWLWVLSPCLDQRPQKGGWSWSDQHSPCCRHQPHSLQRHTCVLVEEEGIALRGIFLIDPEGIVRQITINDTPVGRRSVEETLRLVDAFQFTEKYGEVCPAN